MATRDLWGGFTNVANLGTAWTDVTPVAPTGELYLLQVRAVNRTASSSANLDASLRDSANAVHQYVLLAQPVGPGEVLEFNILVPSARKLSVRASTASVLDIVVVDAVRQY